ncbi:MAG: tellurium resistance protein TerC [Roseiflexus castenholzii]|uniref:TerC family protein n=1 Tax=Roseiflexus castenholzii TaxID=120962 RepID=UPI000CB64C75|nr:MAG: tellurium resistance protein TerC [Roseiflexus castenholzii]
MDIAAVTIIIQLIFLEGILSIDNAAVLGAMVAHLPNDRPIPWPPVLRFLTAWSQRVLGYQREAALKVGLLGAYVGRGLMLALASVIIHVPWLRAIGAAYLVYLAFHHFAELYHAHRAEAGHDPIPRARGGFWSTVLAIELADLAFSIDNVIAAVALSDAFWVVMTGVAIGILVMRFAATIFTRMIAWEPALQTGAFLLLLAIGAELLAEEMWHVHIEEMTQFVISASILILTVVVARTPLRVPVALAARPLIWLSAMIQLRIEATTAAMTGSFRRKEQPTE